MTLITRRPRMARLVFGALAAVGLAAGAVAVAPAAPASATTYANCPSGRLCLFFNSDYQGARSDIEFTDASLSNELFNDGVAGKNGWKVQVSNNAASVWNRTGKMAKVCDTATTCAGPSGWAKGYWLAAGERRNLSTIGLKNKVSAVALLTDSYAYSHQHNNNPY